jgi:uncharacterized protein (DUF433 family)
MTEFQRISLDPAIMGGRACIRGTRVTVGMLVGQIGAGRSVDELVDEYQYVTRDDVLEAIRYAAWLAEEREIELAAE